MIVAHLIYDKRSLLACSLTCYSWYIAAVPHLHHTLITPTYHASMKEKFKWPKPLRNMNRLGLLPLVKKFQIHRRKPRLFGGFSPKQLNRCILRHFHALTNVQELGIDYLDVPSFMPRIRQYFGGFCPTLRSLALREPKGSRRQIIYFIGLFQRLEDLKLLHDVTGVWEEPADDVTLIPPSIPPLRGRLTMSYFRRVDLLKDMIDLFGGIRFRYMDLFMVDGMRLLLATCAETLETLRLYPTDPRGEELSLNSVGMMADDFAARSSLRDFDLSQNASLRTLEVGAHFLSVLQTSSSSTAAPLLTYALSTITSPLFSKVTVFYRDFDFRGVGLPWAERPIRWISPTEAAQEASYHDSRFRAFRTMHEVRDFQLVLCLDVWDSVGEYTMRMLKMAVAAEKAKRGFDDAFPEPLVTISPRGSPRQLMESAGGPSYPWIPL